MGFFKAIKMVDGYAMLEEGLTKDEVVDLLGPPTGQRKRDGVETWIWRNSEFKGILRGGTIERTIEVDFKNDKVVGWDGENISASVG